MPLLPIEEEVAQDAWRFIQGNTIAVDYDAENPDHSPFDFTGWVFWLQFRAEPLSAHIEATGAVALRDVATAGKIQIQVSYQESFKVKKDVKADVWGVHPTYGGRRFLMLDTPVSLAATRPTS